jgi:hypothetical protein
VFQALSAGQGRRLRNDCPSVAEGSSTLAVLGLMSDTLLLQADEGSSRSQRFRYKLEGRPAPMSLGLLRSTTTPRIRPLARLLCIMGSAG